MTRAQYCWILVENPTSIQEPENNLDILSPTGEGSVCPYCGYGSSLTKKCDHCKRTFSKPSVMKQLRKECDNDTAALARWKEGGLKGPFSSIEVRSIRVGSYKCMHTDRMLISSKGIALKIPVLEEDGCQSKTKTANIVISIESLVDIQAHFSRSLAVIFFQTRPSVSRHVSEMLGLSKGPDIPYWDQLSEDETEKRLTLLPLDGSQANKNIIRKAFAYSGIYREIDAVSANDILFKSSPRIRHSIPAHIAATPLECNALASSSSSDENASNKVNGFETDEIQRSVSAKLTVQLVPCWSFERVLPVRHNNVPSHI